MVGPGVGGRPGGNLADPEELGPEQCSQNLAAIPALAALPAYWFSKQASVLRRDLSA